MKSDKLLPTYAHAHTPKVHFFTKNFLKFPASYMPHVGLKFVIVSWN